MSIVLPEKKLEAISGKERVNQLAEAAREGVPA